VASRGGIQGLVNNMMYNNNGSAASSEVPYYPSQ